MTSTSHPPSVRPTYDVGDGVIDDLLTYCARAGWSVTEWERTRLEIDGDLEEVGSTQNLGIGGESGVVSCYQIKCPGATLGR
jgi:hypothetical protein